MESETRILLTKISAADVQKYSSHSKKEEENYIEISKIVDQEES